MQPDQNEKIEKLTSVQFVKKWILLGLCLAGICTWRSFLVLWFFRSCVYFSVFIIKYQMNSIIFSLQNDLFICVLFQPIIHHFSPRFPCILPKSYKSVIQDLWFMYQRHSTTAKFCYRSRLKKSMHLEEFSRNTSALNNFLNVRKREQNEVFLNLKFGKEVTFLSKGVRM